MQDCKSKGVCEVKKRAGKGLRRIFAMVLAVCVALLPANLPVLAAGGDEEEVQLICLGGKVSVSSSHGSDGGALGAYQYDEWESQDESIAVAQKSFTSASVEGIREGKAGIIHRWYTNTLPASDIQYEENTNNNNGFTYVCTETIWVEVTAEHDWGEWIYSRDPSCTTTGQRGHTCQRCKTYEKETVPALGHIFADGDEGTITSEPTCLKDGTRERTCTRCQKVISETIPAYHKEQANCPICGKEAFSWDEATQTLTILRDIPDYEAHGYEGVHPYEAYVEEARRIVVADDVEYIGDYAFAGFSQLVAFGPADTPEGEGVVDVQHTGYGAFQAVKGIKKYTFTENAESFSGCLSNCGTLESVEIRNIPAVDTWGFSPSYPIGNSRTVIESMYINDPEGVIGKENISSSWDGVLSLTLHVKQILGAFYSRNLESLTVEAAEMIPASWIESADSLTSVTIGDGVGSVGDFAFQDLMSIQNMTVSEQTKLGYSNIFVKFPALVERMEAILAGGFILGDIANDGALTVPDGWEDSKIGRENSTEVPGTQVTKSARWNNEEKTEADVQLQFSYTEVPGKDFLFVVDYSGSMAVIGNGETDNDSKFADMQSKLLDVTSQLLEEGNGYENRVAMVSFSDHVKNTLDFTENLAAVQGFIRTDASELQDTDKNPYGNTNYTLALEEAKKLLDSHTGSRETVVIFISDGMPNRDRNGEEKSISALLPEITESAQAIKNMGVEVIGVLQSVPTDDPEAAERYEEVMNAVCSDGMVFMSTDTAGFGEAVNDAIGSAYARYTLTDTVDASFSYVEGSYTVTADGRDVTASFPVSYDDATGTLTWDMTGALPYVDYVISFREALRAGEDGEYPYGTFDTNEGDAAITAYDGTQVNAVETPQLVRSEETEEIPDDPTPETPPTQDPDEPGGEENIPDEETPAGPPATGESDTSKLLAAGMVLTIFGAVLLLTYRRRADLRAQK
jgi:LPXTG-motif cell wall-anchored protein